MITAKQQIEIDRAYREEIKEIKDMLLECAKRLSAEEPLRVEALELAYKLGEKLYKKTY